MEPDRKRSRSGPITLQLYVGTIMKKLFFLALLSMAGLSTFAQQTFVDKLTKVEAGKGTVRVIEDAEITLLVNAPKTSSSHSSSTKIQADSPDEPSEEQTPEEEKPVRKMKASGYRIQLYAGGNTRAARQEAQNIEAKAKSCFPNLTTYTHFKSPRWICSVGDFKTYEEANQFLHQIRQTNQFDEAMIVKSVILIPY